MNYDSREGLQTRAWGPAFWHVLYCVAANYNPTPSDEDKSRIIEFIRSFWKALPCGACRENFKRNVSPSSPAALTERVFDDRESLFDWVYTLHKTVNSALGKGELPFTRKEARDFIEVFRARCNPPNRRNSFTSLTSPEPEKGCNDPLHTPYRLQCTLHFTEARDGEGPRIHMSDFQ